MAICVLMMLGNDPLEIEEYEQFLQSHPKGHFMQSSRWAQVKSQWNFNALVLRDKTNKITGAISILIRRVGFLGLKIAYAPRGPVCDMQNEAALSELLTGAVTYVKRCGCCRLIIDPDVGPDCDALLVAASNAGFGKPRKNENFESIQARFVVRLSLTGKSEEDLLSAFKPKTRYNLRKAIRDGIRVETAGSDKLPEFHALMKETEKRDCFVSRPLEYFTQVLDAMGDHARLYLAYHEDKAAAGAIALRYGDKMWYLYGASSDTGRNCMPTYAVQWAVIQWAMETGCRFYDLRGVPGKVDPESPIYGLYRFKIGFGGEKTEFVGELTFKNGIMRNALLSLAMRARKRLLACKARIGRLTRTQKTEDDEMVQKDKELSTDFHP